MLNNARVQPCHRVLIKNLIMSTEQYIQCLGYRFIRRQKKTKRRRQILWWHLMSAKFEWNACVRCTNVCSSSLICNATFLVRVSKSEAIRYRSSLHRILSVSLPIWLDYIRAIEMQQPFEVRLQRDGNIHWIVTPSICSASPFVLYIRRHRIVNLPKCTLLRLWINLHSNKVAFITLNGTASNLRVNLVQFGLDLNLNSFFHLLWVPPIALCLLCMLFRSLWYECNVKQINK